MMTLGDLRQWIDGAIHAGLSLDDCVKVLKIREKIVKGDNGDDVLCTYEEWGWLGKAMIGDCLFLFPEKEE